MALFGGERKCATAGTLSTRYRIHALDWYWSLGTSQCDRFFVCFHKTLIYSIHTAGSWCTCINFLIYCLLLMQTGRCSILTPFHCQTWQGVCGMGYYPGARGQLAGLWSICMGREHKDKLYLIPNSFKKGTADIMVPGPNLALRALVTLGSLG